MNGGHTTFRRAQNASVRPWNFLAAFLSVFFVLSVVLFALDFYPELTVSGSADETESAQIENGDEVAVQELPIETPNRVVIPAIGVDTLIENPASTDIATLDQALLKGAVRYPASALLGENASMFLFGHQSKLPVVKNKAFKAFNDLQDLKDGDEIIVYSDTAAYHYRVSMVEHKSAEEDSIDLAVGTRILILATCDSFGKKTDRYVVTATFTFKEPIDPSKG